LATLFTFYRRWSLYYIFRNETLCWDILPKNAIYDYLYELNSTFCVGIDSNNRTVPVACANSSKWTFSNEKVRNEKNPFSCLEVDSNNYVVSLPVVVVPTRPTICFVTIHYFPNDCASQPTFNITCQSVMRH
jgi:hypothetical protein